MDNLKRILSLVVAFAMLLSISAFASDENGAGGEPVTAESVDIPAVTEALATAAEAVETANEAAEAIAPDAPAEVEVSADAVREAEGDLDALAAIVEAAAESAKADAEAAAEAAKDTRDASDALREQVETGKFERVTDEAEYEAVDEESGETYATTGAALVEEAKEAAKAANEAAANAEAASENAANAADAAEYALEASGKPATEEEQQIVETAKEAAADAADKAEDAKAAAAKVEAVIEAATATADEAAVIIAEAADAAQQAAVAANNAAEAAQAAANTIAVVKGEVEATEDEVAEAKNTVAEKVETAVRLAAVADEKAAIAREAAARAKDATLSGAEKAAAIREAADAAKEATAAANNAAEAASEAAEAALGLAEKKGWPFYQKVVTAKGVVVTARAQAGVFPKDAVLTAEDLEPKQVEEQMNVAAANVVTAVDISFRLNGAYIQPDTSKGLVDITLDDPTTDAVPTAVKTVKDGKTETLAVEVGADGVAAFTAEHFTPYAAVAGTVYVVKSSNLTATEKSDYRVETKYATIQAALDAAAADGVENPVVVLLNRLTAVQTINRGVTLDLNGFSIYRSAAKSVPLTISNDTDGPITVTITDSSANAAGSIYHSGYGSSACNAIKLTGASGKGVTLRIEKGAFYSGSDVINKTSFDTVSISGGKFDVLPSASWLAEGRGTYTTRSGGYVEWFEVHPLSEKNTFEYSFSGALGGANERIMTIADEGYTANATSWALPTPQANGGSVTAWSVADPSVAAIENGKLVAKGFGETAVTGTYTYDGQTYTSAFTAKVLKPAAKIGTVQYDTLVNALKAVAAGGTIQLLRDVDLTDASGSSGGGVALLQLDKANVTLDGLDDNGGRYTITNKTTNKRSNNQHYRTWDTVKTVSKTGITIQNVIIDGNGHNTALNVDADGLNLKNVKIIGSVQNNSSRTVNWYDGVEMNTPYGKLSIYSGTYAITSLTSVVSKGIYGGTFTGVTAATLQQKLADGRKIIGTAEGLKVVLDTDETPVKAKIGTVNYDSAEAAIADAANGNTVELYESFTGTVTNTKLTVKGNKITVKAASDAEEEITITGTVNTSTANLSTARSESEGIVTYTATVDSGAPAYITDAEGNVVENGYYLSVTDALKAADNNQTVVVRANQTSQIKTADLPSGKDVSLDLGTYSVKYSYYAISAASTGKQLTVKDGTFESSSSSTTYGTVYVTNGTVTVEDGTFTNSSASGNAIRVNGSSAVLNIEGGSFNGKIYKGTSGKLNITGGTFSVDPSAYVKSPYAVARVDENGVYDASGSRYAVGEACKVEFVDYDGTPLGETLNLVKGVVAVYDGEAPTRGGYTFAGWALNGEAYDFGSAVTTDVTLVARWTRNAVTPPPPYDGGSDDGYVAPAAQQETVEIGDEETPLSDLPNLYADVAETDWYRDATAYVTALGLMNGVGDDSFAPDMSSTRGMVATILMRLAEGEVVDLDSFRDVSGDSWYAEGAAWASENGVFVGFEDSTFRGENVITREQLAAALYRYALTMGWDVSGRADLTAYADGDKVSFYAKDAMAWAIDAGVINGVGDDKLDPTGAASRAVLAAMLMRFNELNDDAV